MSVDAEGMIDLLRDNLRDRYKDCFSIVQELLQNADDAQSRHIHFGVSNGLGVDDPMLNGPALYVINDGPVSADDLYSIFRIAAGNKHGDKDKIGKFGLGMKSVFHVCEGFYMFGDGLACQDEFPCFCTPWSEDYHPAWWHKWESESCRVDAEVRKAVGPIVKGWGCWFCVWIPMRTDRQLEEDDGELLSPILKMFPSAADCETFVGVEYAARASRMLPLLKNVVELSFCAPGGVLRRYEMNPGRGRLTMRGGDLEGEVTASGEGTSGFHFHGKAVSHTGEIGFKRLQDCSCWPEKTHKETLRRAVRIVDKTEPHAAVCVLSEQRECASITVSPCVFLPLSGARDQKSKYSVPISGDVSLTIYLHGSMFVDAGRQEFNIGAETIENPVNETELRGEWNRRLFIDGVLPLLIPEIERTIERVDVKTAEAIMTGLPKVGYIDSWLPEVCREWCLVSELTSEGYAWHKVLSSEKIYSLPRPRSKIIHRVLDAVLPNGSHVIDADAGRLVKPGVLRTELPEDVCAHVLEYIAEMPEKDSDNEVLRLFAQECAARLDFRLMPERLQEAVIWRIGARRCSYRQLRDLSDGHHLYCHSEGDLKKIFESAVEWDVVQINEPLAEALKLDVPDFTERFVLDVLQEKPRVASAEMRRPLLDTLLQKQSLQGECEWFRACRYLAHGESDLFECEEPLFMPLDGEYAEISKKMVDALTKRKYGACCHLPKVITEILTPANQEALKLPMSRADSLVLAFSTLKTFDEVPFAEDDWKALVMMVPNMLELPDVKAAVKRIPAFPALDGTKTAITSRVFRENKDFSVPDELAYGVKLLKAVGDDRASARLSRISTVWNPNDCIRLAASEPLEHAAFARILKNSLARLGEYITPDVEQTLKTRSWVDLRDGNVVSPDHVLTIGEMSDLVPECVTLADVADAEVAKLLRKNSLSLGTASSVELLFDKMAAKDINGRFRIGRFENPDGTDKVIDTYTLVKVMTGDGEKHLPVVKVLNRLGGQKIPYAAHVGKLRGQLSDVQLTAIIQILTAAIDFDDGDEKNSKILPLLCSYLDEAAALGNFIGTIVSQVKFFNRKNALKKSKDLCFGVEGVPDKYILSDIYKNAPVFINAIKSTARSRQRTGFDKPFSFKDYFAAWNQEFADRIGGFIVCCSDQADDLDLAKVRYGFESRSVEEARNGISDGLNDFLRNQHCYVLATPDEMIDVISISGEKMEVTATPLASAGSLFCGQFNTCEYVPNSALEMSMWNPPMPREDHSLILRLRKLDASTLAELPQAKLDALFRNTLDGVLAAYPISSPATDQFWESLKHSEQLAVRVTKSIILQSLNTYLPMINCRDDGLKEIFSKWHDLAYSEAEAEQHGNLVQVSRYRNQKADLQKSLEHRIATDPSLGEAILMALRAKMQDYQYDIDSMLFELFQNADDAAEELHDMYGADAPALPDRFCVRFDGHNLMIAHWGRPINQTKVGADSSAKYAAFRADLQKMLMLSQSGKGRVGVKVAGKFGLGFKTVFLACDIPFVVSGKLKFKILGGLLPEPLDEDEEVRLGSMISEFTSVESEIKPTVFVLPLRKDVREKVAAAVAAFTRQIDILAAFSHRIKSISVVGSDGVETWAREGAESGLRMLNVKDAQLLIGERNGRLEPLDKSVATYWVTAPTEMRAELGVALNADFDLDPGRSYLNLCSKKNTSLIPCIAEELYCELVRIYDAGNDEFRKGFFGRLFDILAGRNHLENWRDDGSHAAANAMRQILWDDARGAYLRLMRTRPVLPSGLPGDMNRLCTLGDVERMVCTDIADSELVKLIPHEKLAIGKTVAENNLMKLGEMFFPDEVRVIPLYTIKNLLDDIKKSFVTASPSWCAGEGARILLSALADADKVTVDELQQFTFKTRSGAVRIASELMISDENEGLKAAFMPPEFILSNEYDEQGVAFARLCRGDRRIKIRVLAAQAAAATDPGAQLAVLKYMANGNPSEEFKITLRELRDEGWLANWTDSAASKKLTRREKDRIADVLAINDEEYKQSMLNAWGDSDGSTPQESPVVCRVPLSLPAVRDWWRIHAEEEIKDYNREIYDRAVVENLSFDLDSLDNRKAWMQVLVLGAAHALGMRKRQHKGFICELIRRGYWDIYCKRDLQASEWLDTIDDFLENEELNGGKYNYWMRLFFRIYQFSRNLDTYVQLFKSWNWAKKCEAPDLAAVKKNATLSGSGIDVPGLQKALSLTGLHFVYREMVRRHAINNPLIYPQCFVPYETVAEVAWNIRVSSEIYRKVVAEIGERDATFGGAFDIALTQYDKHGREG